MPLIFASQTNEMRGMVGVIHRALDVVKTELNTEIDSERNESRKENADMNTKFEELTKRIAKVELAASTPPSRGR